MSPFNNVVVGHNNYFNFKQFRIIQEKTAMRVGVDGVLLGAWTNANSPSRILDVGTGTGLLALMMAQRFPDAFIDAVEIDAEAAEEARFNIAQSKWSDRIRVFHTSFQQFAENPPHLYDLVISNPPYFNQPVGIKEEKRIKARDNGFLPLEELFAGAARIINKEGMISIIYPNKDFRYIQKAAFDNNIFISRKMEIRTDSQQEPVRAMVQLGLNTDLQVDETLSLYEVGTRVKTSDYVTLIENFH